jgi:hypothetical protein
VVDCTETSTSVSFPCPFENIALIILFGQSFQETLTEREDYTIDLFVPTSLQGQLLILQKILFCKTSYPNEEFNCTKTSTWVSFPCPFEKTALIIVFAKSFQGTLIEREGYTIDLLVLTSFYFTSYLNHTKTS